MSRSTENDTRYGFPMARELRQLLTGEETPFLIGPSLDRQLLQQTLRGEKPQGFQKAAILSLAAAIDTAVILQHQKPSAPPEEMMPTSSIDAIRTLGREVITHTQEDISAAALRAQDEKGHFEQAYTALQQRDMIVEEGEKALTMESARLLIFSEVMSRGNSAVNAGIDLWNTICTYFEKKYGVLSFSQAVRSFSESLSPIMNLASGDVPMMEIALGPGRSLEGNPYLLSQEVYDEEGELSHVLFTFAPGTRRYVYQQYAHAVSGGQFDDEIVTTRPFSQDPRDIVGCFALPGGKDMGPSLVWTALRQFATNLQAAASTLPR